MEILFIMASQYIEIKFLQTTADSTNLSVTHRTVVNLDYRRKVCRRAGKETLLGHIKFIALY